jgi:putative ABC transport system permease protein
MKYLRLVTANFRRRKLRTGFTLLSIAVAFLLFGFLSAIRQAFSLGIDVAGADRLLTTRKVSLIQPLPYSYLDRIGRVEGVREVTHSSWFGGYFEEKEKNFPMFPVEPEGWTRMYPEYLIEPDEMKAWQAEREAVIVGRYTADRFGWKVGDRVPIYSPIWPRADGKETWEFNVAGIYEGQSKSVDTSIMFLRYDYFDEARSFGKGLVGWYIFRVSDPQKSADVARKVDAMFANSPAETKTATEKAFVQSFANQIGNIGAIITGILSAVFFTILLVAGNTIALSVRERTAELAVLKTIGFSSPLVMTLVFAESLLIAAVGGGAGLAVAWLVISLGDPTGGFLPVWYIPPASLLFGAMWIVLLGLATGLFPAWQALRLRIADGLRRV